MNAPRDLTPPNVKIAAPADGVPVEGVVHIQVDAADGEGVDKVEIRLPSGESAYPMKAVPYVWDRNSASVADGDYKLKATACDKAGNCGSAEIGISVKNNQ